MYILPKTFENPSNGYRESVDNWSMLWALLFGWIYYAIRGLWVHMFVQVVITIGLGALTGGPGALIAVPMWLIYAVLTPSIIEARYRKIGWREFFPDEPWKNESGGSTAAPYAPGWSQRVSEASAGRAAPSPRPVAPSLPVREPASASVADELEKLASLRDRGVLTPQEFDAQKVVVLAASASRSTLLSR